MSETGGAGGPTVLVTGATGFVGRNVAGALRGARFRVRAAVRRPGAEGFADETVRISAIGSATDWNEALAGVHAVVHAAGLAHRPARARDADRELYAEVNVEGTRRLAEAAASRGIGTFVFLSSIAVNGAETDGIPFRESDEPHPVTVYGQSKALAEDAVRRVAERSGMRALILRPPLIHGPAAPGNFALLARAVGLRLPLPFGRVDNRRAYLGIDNLAGFIVDRLRGPEPAGTFILADDEQCSTARLASLIASALGRSPRLLPVPPRLLRGGLSVLRRKEMAGSILGSLEVDTARMRSTGWSPPCTLEEGIRRALRRSEGAE
ncbi:NAD-dependent epimerase/dehydratase family protein [Propylenella binzhouense]|nr:NAD-dependent epimerase/dehydratase family protein [Propylenella binzhouense]